MMGTSIFSVLLSSFLVCSTFLLQPSHGIKKSYVVYLGSHSHGPNPSSADMDSATNSHYDFLASVLGSHEKAKEAVFYSYNKHINGFAALLEEEEATQIKKHPKVVSVFLNRMHKVHTTRSWEFLGLETKGRVRSDSAWKKARFGEDTIIANIDTGVWPESMSFSDEGYGPIPAKWRGNGICEIHNLPAVASNKAPCNRKLIGARMLYKGYEALYGPLLQNHSARDNVGHGTHTLSIAGGNFVKGASVLNNANGTAKGGCPRARVAAYKACWSLSDEGEGGCSDSDVLSAFDEAISDGVDVLFVPIGDANNYNQQSSDQVTLLTDGISIGSYHAMVKGVVVICSAGNEGPEAASVKNVAPWLFTVAASSIDRDFNNFITLGNTHRIKGTSLGSGLASTKFYSLIRAGDAKLTNVTLQDAQMCKAGTLDANKVRGKILMCQQNRSLSPLEQDQEAWLSGAMGIFLENDGKSGNTVTTMDTHLLATSIYTKNTSAGKKLNSYYNSTENPIALMTKAKTIIGIKPAPIMASFSSRGPNILSPSLLKPDITAPGLNILGAYTEDRNNASNVTNKKHFAFNILSGTSIACSHVAAIAGLLKTLHPTWSPAAIKSAIMTTATIIDNTKKLIRDGVDDGPPATPLAYGSGHVRPHLAIYPGLVYDLTHYDYLNFLCASGYSDRLISVFNSEKPYKCPRFFKLRDLNYPSITIPKIGVSPLTISRTLTNVGPPSTYSVKIRAPKGVKVDVHPNTLRFNSTGENKNFRIVFQAMGLAKSENFVFGKMTWTDGKHRVRSRIVVSQGIHLTNP